ncbi:MAG: neutral/alkaline non-lysosomal ceramidase N-terminal domain-containing protein [Bryobacterales bacterium]|nr:neutral/alkaline non-lysosomal ceramidase N-terminal domain-containing protein [Bryobacterales bacterium]
MKLLLSFVVGLTSLQAAWQAGVAAVDITPRESIWMAGYAARTKPSEGVRQPIWAKALALRDDSGRTAVIVTLDLVGIRRTMAEGIAANIQRKHNIPREAIWFNASHTHSAPLVGVSPSYNFGEYSEKQAPVIQRYTLEVATKIEAVMEKAIIAMAPATLQFQQGLAGFAVNRRRVGHREYPGPVDHDVPVLAVRSAEGQLRAILFGYACHNTVLGDYMINGDYAGYAQAELQRRYPGAVAMYVQGAGADSNPLPRRKVEHAERYGMTLADAVDEVVAGRMRAVDSKLKIGMQIVDLKWAGPRTKPELEERLKSTNERTRGHAQRLLKALERDGQVAETYPYPIQAWKFGDQFTVLTLAGELTVDYSLRFKRQYGPDTTWVAGYSNDVFGYIPSLRVLKEGGYEGGEAFLFGSLPGPFADDVEDRISGGVEKAIAGLK